MKEWKVTLGDTSWPPWRQEYVAYIDETLASKEEEAIEAAIRWHGGHLLEVQEITSRRLEAN